MCQRKHDVNNLGKCGEKEIQEGCFLFTIFCKSINHWPKA